MQPRSKPEQVAAILEQEILAGTLSDGAALASESALVERFAVSRSSVRKGLGILAAKGLIETRVGIGSFVTFGGDVVDGQRGWSVALSDRGIELATRLERIARIGMDIALPAGMPPQLAPGADVLAVDRVRFRTDTGAGLTLERSRMPWRADFEAVLAAGLSGGSLSRTLEERGLVPVSGEEWANVRPALSAEEAVMLRRPAGEPMLLVRRLTRDGADEIVEFVETLLDPQHFGLHMEF